VQISVHAVEEVVQITLAPIVGYLDEMVSIGGPDDPCRLSEHRIPPRATDGRVIGVAELQRCCIARPAADPLQVCADAIAIGAYIVCAVKEKPRASADELLELFVLLGQYVQHARLFSSFRGIPIDAGAESSGLFAAMQLLRSELLASKWDHRKKRGKRNAGREAQAATVASRKMRAAAERNARICTLYARLRVEGKAHKSAVTLTIREARREGILKAIDASGRPTGEDMTNDAIRKALREGSNVYRDSASSRSPRRK
jgi:hypothetical protein